MSKQKRNRDLLLETFSEYLGQVGIVDYELWTKAQQFRHSKKYQEYGEYLLAEEFPSGTPVYQLSHNDVEIQKDRMKALMIAFIVLAEEGIEASTLKCIQHSYSEGRIQSEIQNAESISGSELHKLSDPDGNVSRALNLFAVATEIGRQLNAPRGLTKESGKADSTHQA